MGDGWLRVIRKVMGDHVGDHCVDHDGRWAMMVMIIVIGNG